MFGMDTQGGPPTMNQQRPQGFATAGMPQGQTPGLAQGVPGLSPNPLLQQQQQQQQMKMMIQLLQQGGHR